MSKIDEILYDMNQRIEMEYGIGNAIHTVVLDHETFNGIIIDLFRSGRDKFKYSPSDMNDLKICGVRVLAREDKKP